MTNDGSLTYWLGQIAEEVRKGTLAFGVREFLGRVQAIRTPEDYCPVCALCNLRIGTDYTYEYSSAAENLGMPWEVADKIAGAADKQQKENRRAVVEACGLEVTP